MVILFLFIMEDYLKYQQNRTQEIGVTNIYYNLNLLCNEYNAIFILHLMGTTTYLHSLCHQAMLIKKYQITIHVGLGFCIPPAIFQ